MASRSTTQMGGFFPSWAPTVLLGLTISAVALIVGLAIGMGPDKLIYLVVLLAIPVAFKWPLEVAMGAVALTFPFDSILVAVKNGQSTTTVTWFASVGAGALLLARILSGVRQPPPKVARLWLALVIWGSMTTFWAVDSTVALKRLPMAWSLLILYLVAVNSKVTKKQLDVIITFTIIGGLAAAIWASYSYFTGSSWANSGRASISLDTNDADPNFFAAMLLVPLSLAIGLYRSNKSLLMKGLGAVTIALAALAIFLTMSRGALVALIFLAASTSTGWESKCEP